MKYSEFFKLIEKKDHLIKKISSLTDEQKQQAIDFFTKHPSYENEIDWNRKDLSWDDFEKVFNKERISKSQIPNFVKEGKHYLTLYKEKGITIYQPLTYVASRYLASDDVAPYVEGKWCIAYQKERYHWDSYSIDDNTAFLFIFTEDTKYALQIDNNFPSSSYDLNETIRDSLYDEYYNSAWMDLYDEYKDLVDTGKIDPEEYIDEDYIEDNIGDYLENQISSTFNGSFRDIIYYLLSNNTLIVWDAQDSSFTSSGALSCLENLPGITLEQLFNFCQKAVSNINLVQDMRDEDITISRKMEQLRVKVLREEFWNLYKKSQKKGIPFVYKGDLTFDVLYTINSNGLLLERDSNSSIIGFQVKIDKLIGDFDLGNLNIVFESMQNFPTEVTGNFGVRLGKSVTKLENCPRTVGGDFDIRVSHLQTLEGSPDYVGGDFLCGGGFSIDSLEALKGAPAQVDGLFKIYAYNNFRLVADILRKLGIIGSNETYSQVYSLIPTLIREKYLEIKDLITDFLEKNGTKLGKGVQIIV